MEAVEIQMEHRDENGQSTYNKKVIEEEKQKERICERLRNIPIEKAPADQPNPITSTPMIIILRGKKDHHLVLTETMAYYDQIAYEYTEKGVFEKWKAPNGRHITNR